jgi:hypothetical protein
MARDEERECDRDALQREDRIRRNGHRVLLVQASYVLVSTRGTDFELRAVRDF